ncbi:hypothetical protein DSO57_1039264 [Entomophthora muscae]|uniref:Uncharacterized protein n=1 Tax=Entomophthora muscae TaxID=34485 RepID=A0ACC2RPD8_9FUNG|nr:hypothetical protein DSO57_1039264 [Entomophthora muscae]
MSGYSPCSFRPHPSNVSSMPSISEMPASSRMTLVRIWRAIQAHNGNVILDPQQTVVGMGDEFLDFAWRLPCSSLIGLLEVMAMDKDIKQTNVLFAAVGGSDDGILLVQSAPPHECTSS